MKYELWDPFEDMKNFRKEMDNVFDEFWKSKRGLLKNMDVHEPSVDVIEKEQVVEITADLPGIDKKDIDVHLSQDRIEIKAKKSKVSEKKKKNYYMNERAVSGFYKAFMLPSIVNPDKAKSSFSNGILKISAPKLKSLPKKAKRLAIK